MREFILFFIKFHINLCGEFNLKAILALSAGALEYADSTSAEGVRPPPNEAYLLAVGGDPQGARTEPWWLSSHWCGDRVVNGLQHNTLALTWSDGAVGLGPIRSIGWSRHTVAHMLVFLPIVSYKSTLVELFDLLFRNYSQPFISYVLEGRGGWGSIVLRDKTYDRCWIVV